MVEEVRIDWARLEAPLCHFRFWVPGNLNKAGIVAQKLCTEYLYTPDENRQYGIALSKTLACLEQVNVTGLHLAYETGDFGGVLVFSDIVPGFTCHVSWKIWDKSLWTPSFVKEGRALVASVMDAFKLEKMESETADPKVARVAKLAGFSIEGVKKKSFRWDGKLYDLMMLGMVREGGNG